MWDLDFILGLGVDRDRPRLVELGRVLGRGRTSRRILAWSTGRIGAACGEGRVSIDRNLGLVGEGPVVLSPLELAALNGACLDWRKRRDGWAAFWSSNAGYPACMGGAWYRQAPGLDSQRIKVGSSVIGRKEGRDFVGKEERRTLADPIAVADGVEIEAELWRVGEAESVPEGERVGVVYRLADTARLEAERHGAILRKGTRFIGLEPAEDAFVDELLAAVLEG